MTAPTVSPEVKRLAAAALKEAANAVQFDDLEFACTKLDEALRLLGFKPKEALR